MIRAVLAIRSGGWSLVEREAKTRFLVTVFKLLCTHTVHTNQRWVDRDVMLDQEQGDSDSVGERAPGVCLAEGIEQARKKIEIVQVDNRANLLTWKS
jgi:hypothetical protein